MNKDITPATAVASGVEEAWRDIGASFERFCLTAGIATLVEMMERDSAELSGPRYGRQDGKEGHRWGRTAGKLGFHGGKVAIERPRVRARDGHELALPSWEAAQAEDWLGRWAMNLMLINVSTRRFGRAVRLPGGDIAAPHGAGVSKSAASRRFVALSAERMAEWMAADLSQLDLLAIQIDGMHVTSELTLLAAVGIDGEGVKHPLGLLEGATENAAAVGQSDRARAGSEGLPPVHRRRVEGAGQGDPQHLRPPYADPALSDPQGAQHPGAAAQASACHGAHGAPPGVGTG
jgi:putative transposase